MGFLKGLSTSKVSDRERGPEPISVSEMGPRSDEGPEGPSIAEKIIRFGYPEELKRFWAEIEARRAKEPKIRYLRCDKCDFKAFLEWRRNRSHVGESCIQCNTGGYSDGGHLIEMTDKEVREWQAENAKREKILSERRERARKNAEHDDRRRLGLE